MYDITVKDSSLEEKHDWHEYKCERILIQQ